MEVLLDQIDVSLGHQGYYLSLMAALTIPDICGAMDSDDGVATGARYAEWYEQWARPQFERNVSKMLGDRASEDFSIENPLDGETCYRFRCSLLHQGRTQHPKSQYSRIIFIEPGATTNTVHYGQLNDALCIDVKMFCKEIVAGAREWLNAVKDTERYQGHYERFAKRHPNGLKPYIGGVPVVG